MITTNEQLLIEALKEEGVEQSKIFNILKVLKGCRIYVREKECEKILIKNKYEELRKKGYLHYECVEYLSKFFDKSKNVILYYLKKE